MSNDLVRSNWSFEEIQALYESPLLELIFKAGTLHRFHHTPSEVQVCSIITVKTGGCPEDCKYCSMSSRYKTFVKAEPLMDVEEVLKIAKNCVDNGVTRVCLGAAWREVRDSQQFENILEMVKGITAMGAEVCCTLGMLKEHQAQRLADAGLYAYNHNLDTSREYYSTIITTRKFEDRLNTLDIVEKSGISVCCGGIIGLGESPQDRISMLLTLASRNPHPDSVPINFLVRIEGTPLVDTPQLPIWEMIRLVAVTRIVMPKAMVRLSGGRMQMTFEQQALCFLAGANSIHSGEKLLTTPNPGFDDDDAMFQLLGLTKRPAFAKEKSQPTNTMNCPGCCS